ncbi:MAG: hypothetical protein WC229_00990 [Candidatus Paceibacterota bacterium]|jgi:hypothetical protein
MKIPFWKGKEIDITKRQLVAFVVLVFIILVPVGLSILFKFSLASASPILIITLLSILFLFTWVFAGMIILEALFLVGGELTLMIFLAQSYCEVKNRTQVSDNALMTLFGFSLFYLGISFLKSLYRGFIKSLKTFEDKKTGKTPWLVIVMFGLSIGIFIWQLYEVINPIINDLCVYNIIK